jgi:hypothetical protein
MGYNEQEPPPQDERPGCIDILVITRTVFAILFWPLAVLFAIVIDIAVIVMLLVTNAPLALIPIAITIGAIWLFSRWERERFRPPDA